MEKSGECRARPTNEDAAALVCERPGSQEGGVTRWLTHDSVCLVSDSEKTSNRRDGKRGEREEMQGEGVRGQSEGGRKTDGTVKKDQS